MIKLVIPAVEVDAIPMVDGDVLIKLGTGEYRLTNAAACRLSQLAAHAAVEARLGSFIEYIPTPHERDMAATVTPYGAIRITVEE